MESKNERDSHRMRICGESRDEIMQMMIENDRDKWWLKMRATNGNGGVKMVRDYERSN